MIKKIRDRLAYFFIWMACNMPDCYPFRKRLFKRPDSCTQMTRFGNFYCASFQDIGMFLLNGRKKNRKPS